jgi:hypothetical protein
MLGNTLRPERDIFQPTECGALIRQRRAPFFPRRLDRAGAGPKPVAAAHARRAFELDHNERRQRAAANLA